MAADNRLRQRPVTAALFVLAGVLSLLMLHSDAAAQDATAGDPDLTPITTYERFLPLAEAGDPEARHLLGYMYFYGEGVELDYDKAHEWFHLAAEEGDPKSMHNLGMFHAHTISRIPAKFYDPREANLWFSLAAVAYGDPEVSAAAVENYGRFLATDKAALIAAAPRNELGETVYTALCAGCHGFDGRSSFFPAPSFALGEKLFQSDAVLIANISRSLNPWSHRVEDVPRHALQAAMAYIRGELVGRQARVELSASLLASTPAPKQSREDLVLGEKIFTRFCGGCHGFNGIAAYVNSPSFAIGERLHKSDEELAASIRNGLGEMPSWEFMLKPAEMIALVNFLRSLQLDYQNGIGVSLRSAPDRFYRFTPKSLTTPGVKHGLPSLD